MRRWLLLTAGLAVLGLVAAGCGDDDTATTAQEGTTTAPDSPDDSDGAEPGDGATVALADTALGRILVDGDGRTLYLFTSDSPGMSVCIGDCLASWPPLEAPADLVAGDGVDEALLDTTTRDDGTEQVTYAEMPLYHFAGDSAPGDANGQGANDVWWVVDATGEAVMGSAASGGIGY